MRLKTHALSFHYFSQFRVSTLQRFYLRDIVGFISSVVDFTERKIECEKIFPTETSHFKVIVSKCCINSMLQFHQVHVSNPELGCFTKWTIFNIVSIISIKHFAFSMFSNKSCDISRSGSTCTGSKIVCIEVPLILYTYLCHNNFSNASASTIKESSWKMYQQLPIIFLSNPAQS